MNWIRAAQSEVKRDMEMARDEVRVMTVHGAKGLEAKNVIFIDHTTTRPEGAHPPRLLTVPIAGAPPGCNRADLGCPPRQRCRADESKRARRRSKRRATNIDDFFMSD